MKFAQAVKKAGSIMALARVFNIRRQAVQSWKKHGIPDARLEELRTLHPEWFPSKAAK